jgi:hypothetical protein
VREDFVLDRTRSLRGRVLDASGQPAADVWVSARCAGLEAERGPAVRELREAARSVSDAKGAFQLSGLADSARTCIAEAEQPGGGIGRVGSAQPGQYITVQLQQLGALAGSIVAPDPSATGRITVVVANEDFMRQRTQVLASAAQPWNVDDVLPGALELLAYDTHGHSARQSVQLAPGQHLRDITLELEMN